MTEYVPVKYAACLIALSLHPVQSVIHLLSVIKKALPHEKENLNVCSGAPLFKTAIPSFCPYPWINRITPNIQKPVPDITNRCPYRLFSCTLHFTPAIYRPLTGIVVLNQNGDKVTLEQFNQFPSPCGDYGSSRAKKS